ncbi:hypothetical protein RI367_005801 [Sorochytrium milnesiophthora]
MLIKHLKSLLLPPSQDAAGVSSPLRKVYSLTWSPNGQKLAVVLGDRIVQLYDETGERKDRFATKPVDPKNAASYRVTALAFSPDSTKLAVAQSDGAVFVYKLGLEWGEKKSICNKFINSSSASSSSGSQSSLPTSAAAASAAAASSDQAEVTTLIWPKEQPNVLIYGMADGRVRAGNLKSNKPATLYHLENNAVVALASNNYSMYHPNSRNGSGVDGGSALPGSFPHSASSSSSPSAATGDDIMTGNAFISGHQDGSIYRYCFDDGHGANGGAQQGLLTVHKCPPYALSWGESIVAAGHDLKITFYTNKGKVLQEFEYDRDDSQQEFTVAKVSPSGQAVVVGSFDRFHIFGYSQAKGQWFERPTKVVNNLYTVTALTWKPDGSRLISGSVFGSVDMYDCCLRRVRYRGKFEFTYISTSQVIVKRYSTGSRIILKSHYGYEITKVDIFQDQFLIANTSQTLLMGDLATCKLSEIPWQSAGNEKFYFQNPSVCMVFNAGELSMVEYGMNDLLGSCRTEYMNPHLISVRINERKSEHDVKMIAYLIDIHTINVLDLTSGLTVASINHDSKIDWLELSGKANKLLFRDKRRNLHLLDVATQSRSTLLGFCSYVQWVPNSDVIVAQSRNNLCIWYSVDAPERVTMFPIKGEIEDIQREGGRTEVIVDEGVNTVTYTLDEGLIEFGTAIDDKDYERAVALLETLELTPETEAMWKTLGDMALQDRKLVLAERCAAALGDIAKTHYLHNVNQLIEHVKETDPMVQNPFEHYAVRAKLAVLDKQFKMAERIYLEQGRVEEAMDMYQEMHKWDLSIRVAEMANHAEVENLRKNYFQWLIESGQEDKAGELKETEGDYIGAINLYLKGGMPARAALIITQRNLTGNLDLVERIATALAKTGLHEKAGQFYEKLGDKQKALESYKRGKAYRAAVELSRFSFPSEVVVLEEQWGDYLVSQRQMEAAVNHYVEAGNNLKAVDAAITAKAWKKAVGIMENLEPSDALKRYFLIIAKHFDGSGEYAQAERYYVQAGHPQSAVTMYTKANKWDKAYNLAVTFMTPEEVSFLYTTKAHEFESIGNYKDAEKLYITIGEPDLAINMYKGAKNYDEMIRLVSIYHKDLLGETHAFLAKALEADGAFKQAEHHYIESEDWKGAINMYCANNLFEDGYRIAKSHGGPHASKQVAYLWARSLGGESAAKLLTKFALLDYAIDFASENGAFDFAFELAKFSDKSKVVDVHLKQAMYLEDEGKYKEAETAFVQAGKPKEAILMYIHNEDWDAAKRVAEAHEPAAVTDVLVGQAKVAFNQKDYAKVEGLLLRAQRPELMLNMYKEAAMWKEALSFAKEYIPAKLSEIHAEYDRFMASQGGGDGSGGAGGTSKDDICSTALLLEQQREFSRAADMYLKLTTAHTNDLGVLEECWERAAELVIKFVPERGSEVVKAVASKLISIRRFEQAGDLLSAVELHKEAADSYVQGKCWEKAKALATVAPKLAEYVDKQYVEHLRDQGQTDALMGVNVGAGLDLMAEKGDWERCLDVAAAQAPETLNKYLNLFAAAMLKQNKKDYLVRQLAKHGVPTSPSLLTVYAQLALEITQSGSAETQAALRDMLKKIVFSVPNLPDHFRSFLFISHLQCLKHYCATKKELRVFAAKQAVALLRYTNILPVDAAFLDAGNQAKAAGLDKVAFVCLNRFLDICDAIDERDPSLLENSEFANSDIPTDFTLPDRPADEKVREEVRDWVLSVSLEKKVSQEVDKRKCDNCSVEIYDASLVCYNCEAVWEPCIVTGYPIVRNMIRCSNCSMASCKDDWNKYIIQEKACPWCNTAQMPTYSLK